MGTALGTFSCEDPDAPGSPLRYQLRAHSPQGLASLRLRDRVLEVPGAAHRELGEGGGWSGRAGG